MHTVTLLQRPARYTAPSMSSDLMEQVQHASAMASATGAALGGTAASIAGATLEAGSQLLSQLADPLYSTQPQEEPWDYDQVSGRLRGIRHLAQGAQRGVAPAPTRPMHRSVWHTRLPCPCPCALMLAAGSWGGAAAELVDGPKTHPVA